MKIAAYLLFVGGLVGLAWHYPFLFELPVVGALAGAYWLFARGPGDGGAEGRDDRL